MKSRFSGLIIVCLTALVIMACEREPGKPSQAKRALEEVKRLYEQAKDKAPEDPVEWAKEDIERYGDWEYRIIKLADSEPSKLEEQLNKVGKERWEVFWIERSEADVRVFLKRPAISYLRSIPLSKLGRALSGGDSSE